MLSSNDKSRLFRNQIRGIQFSNKIHIYIMHIYKKNYPKNYNSFRLPLELLYNHFKNSNKTKGKKEIKITVLNPSPRKKTKKFFGGSGLFKWICQQ